MSRPGLSVLPACGIAPTAAPDRGVAELLRGGLLQSRAGGAVVASRTRVDFASQDYLGLARHPAVQAAARAASLRPGAGSVAVVSALEARLADLLELPAARCFASGTQAIRQTLAAVLCPGDDLLLDAGAPAAMVEAALAAGARLHRFPSVPVEAVERRLGRLARQVRRGKLVVAVAAVTAHGSKLAALADLADLARRHGAVLVADVSHDFGAMAPGGRGVMELDGSLGRIDVVLGSLAKCLGAAGGFAAFRDPDLAFRLPEAPGALSPANASAILAACTIAFGAEGHQRRRNLRGAALRLRNHLMADGMRVLGSASPLVPVPLPLLTALPRTALLESAGPRVTLLMAPAVPLHAPRWRIQLAAEHQPADIDDLAGLIRDVCRAFDRPLRRLPVAV